MGKAKGKRKVADDGTVMVAGKNANGTGSIYLDSRGRYRASYYDRSGKLRTVSARTKAEAAARRAAKVAELASATPAGRLGVAVSVGAVADYWLTNVAPAEARPSTLHTYAKEVRRIVDAIGTVPVAELDLEVVQTFLSDLRAGRAAGSPAPLAESSVRNVRARLRQIAEQAVDLGYLTVNPVSKARVPRARPGEGRERRSLTPAEVQRLVSAAAPGRLGAAVALTFTVGLRVSEVLGLAWEDVDLDAGTAAIRRGSTYTGGGVGQRLGPPKTAGTAGVHHLSPTVVELLRLRRSAQAAERLAAGPAWETVTYDGAELNMIFTTLAGGLVLRQTVYETAQSAAETAGVPWVGLHGGRRSVVTALYQAGQSLEDVARYVGHASPATTAGYVTGLGDRPKATADRAAALFDPAAGDA